MHHYTFRLTKADKTPIGEIRDATGRQLIVGLSRPSSATFHIRDDNPLMLNLFAEDTLLEVLRTSDAGIKRVFWGHVLSSQFATEGDNQAGVTVSAADPSWRLSKRLTTASYTNTDKAEIARQIINSLNGGTYKTGIKATVATKCGTSANYNSGEYREVLQVIDELSHTTSGFDWRILPEGAEWEGTHIGEWWAEAIIGEGRPNCVFEYGIGRKNMAEMTFHRDLTTMLNYGVMPEAETGFFGEAKAFVKEDVPSEEEHGRWAGTVDVHGLENKILKEAWLADNILFRKQPQRIVTMTPDREETVHTGRVPVFEEDYDIGDVVIARAVTHNVQLFAGSVRVHAATINIDEMGNSVVIPTLVEEEGSGSSGPA